MSWSSPTSGLFSTPLQANLLSKTDFLITKQSSLSSFCFLKFSRAMEPIGVEQQVSMTVDNQEIVDGDSEVDSSGSSSEQFRVFTGNGMIRVDEGTSEHEIIKKSFLICMGLFEQGTTVVAIHRNSYFSLAGQARLQTFRIFSEAVWMKCGGNANIKYASYGSSTKEICEIISMGSVDGNNLKKNDSSGFGIYLSPANFPIDGVLSSVVDENGLRHLLLCRVILGSMEVVCADSEQLQLSSKEFDSGVDDLSEPRRYIIWGAYMNSHFSQLHTTRGKD